MKKYTERDKKIIIKTYKELGNFASIKKVSKLTKYSYGYCWKILHKWWDKNE